MPDRRLPLLAACVLLLATPVAAQTPPGPGEDFYGYANADWLAATTLPAGPWQIVTPLDPAAAEEAALGWLFAQYRFDRYRAGRATPAQLVPPAGVDVARIEAIAAGERLTRDLVNLFARTRE